MPMNSEAPRRSSWRSGEAVSRPSPESTMKRMGWKVVSGAMSVAMGRAQVTLTPSRTGLAWRGRGHGLLHFAGVDLHHGREKGQGLVPRPLEGVAPDDGAEAAAVADGTALLVDRLVVLLGGAAREDHDAPAG